MRTCLICWVVSLWAIGLPEAILFVKASAAMLINEKNVEIALFLPLHFSSLSFHGSLMEMPFSWGSRPPNLDLVNLWQFPPPNFQAVVPWGDRRVAIIYSHGTTRRIGNWLKGQQAVSMTASATRRSLFSQLACASRTLWGNLILTQLQLTESTSTDSVQNHGTLMAMTNRPNQLSCQCILITALWIPWSATLIYPIVNTLTSTFISH